MIAKLRSPPEIPIFSGRASGTKQIVNEHRSMRDKAIIPDRDELTDKRMRLNSTPIANLYAFLYLNKRADKSLISKHASIKVDWLNQSNVFTKRYVDNSCVPNFRPYHKGGINTPAGTRRCARESISRCLLGIKTPIQNSGTCFGSEYEAFISLPRVPHTHSRGSGQPYSTATPAQRADARNSPSSF